MKKLLTVLVIAAIGMASCKKEEPAKPVSTEKIMGGGKTNMTEWD